MYPLDEGKSMMNGLSAATSSTVAERAGVSDFFQRTLDSLLSHMAILQPDGTIVAVNAAWNAFAARNDLVESLCGPGINYLAVCEGATGSCREQAHLIARGIRDVGRGRIPDFRLEYPCRSPTEYFWYILRVTRFAAGGQVYIVVTHDDITERKLAELRLQEANRLLQAQATTDGLTGIANRRHFDRELAREWRRHARDASPLSLLLVDVDHFKKYNDARGHLAGDDCLREVARALRETACRPGDLVARYGGEEFAAVLPETDREGAMAVAGLVRERLRLRALPHGDAGAGPLVTLSVGGASMVPPTGGPAARLIERADRALYEAKAAGRDRARYSEPKATSVARRTTEVAFGGHPARQPGEIDPP